MSRRNLVVSLLGLGAVAAGVAVVLAFVRGDTTTVLDADQARAIATATATTSSPPTTTPFVPDASPEPPSNEPPAGDAVVYVYQTVGFETIDALVGARHDYPPQTFLTVQTGGCGRILRWQAIEERWTSWDVCDPERLTIAGIDSFHRWFGVDDLQQYRCAESAPYLPPSVAVTTWTFVCSTGDRMEETTVDVIDVETLDINGQEVEALHLRFSVTLTGESTGERVIDRWFRSHDALLVKEVSSTASASSSLIGTVNYTEEYEIILEALDPMTR